jgi:hypothetical protein
MTTGVQTITGAANGTGTDLTIASSDFGAVAYLQVTTVTGTSVTFHIEDSANDVDYTDIAGMAFSAVTPASAPIAQRIASTSATANIRRYVRWVAAGTFNPASFQLVFIRPLVALS